MTYDVIIIGAGVVGASIARELAKYKIKVAVLEKDNDVGNETSNANSAIIHSGYDPECGSLKAKLNVLGNAMFDTLCKELDVKFKRIGSITLALDDNDVKTLKELQIRATKNGVETSILSREELLKIELHISNNVKAGLLANTAGIIDPFNFCVHLMENAVDNGVELYLNTKVVKIVKENDIFIINDKFKAKMVINCAGLFSDEINEMINPKSFEIIPRKGEYLVLDHFDDDFVKHTLFLVPSIKGKGVLISPTSSNNYLIGPSAEVCLKDDKDTDKMTIEQIKKTAMLMVDNIPFNQVIHTFAGIRPTPANHDFIIEESKTKNFINVAGIESPGFVSSPAIAKMVVEDFIINRYHYELKKDFNPYVRPYLHINELPFEKRKEIVDRNKDYGEIICKCEKVSKGEIIDCLNRSVPPHSIKALKKRLRVGFGKCQGGMCQSYALHILANYYHKDINEIPYDSLDSYILLDELKGAKD